jgi:imidazole glycerol-phosphate synthase subunit HisF
MRRRLIPILLIQDRRLVKTIRFRRPSYVGDPINAVKIFNDKEVDELIVLDIGRDGRSPDFDYLEMLAGEAFMPLTYGGGVRHVREAEQLHRLGVEKVALRTVLFQQPSVAVDMVERFDSQSVVAVIDVQRLRNGHLRVITGDDDRRWRSAPIDIAHALVDLGVGEVLVQAVHRDGTLEGPDLALMKSLSGLPVPVVAAGGVASLDDCKELMRLGSDAVAAGAFFVYHGPHRAVLISYPQPAELARLVSA